MKLELKHLAPYLPYELKGESSVDDKKLIETLKGLSEEGVFTGFGWMHWKDFKPILRPLSDLTKEIEHGGNSFYPHHKLGMQHKNHVFVKMIQEDPLEMSLEDALKLFEWHFDVFGLIEKGLATDINTT